MDYAAIDSQEGKPDPDDDGGRRGEGQAGPDDARGVDGGVRGRPRLRVLLEASTESEWVAAHLEGLGHEAIVADPNYAPTYGTRSRRIKTTGAIRRP